MTHSQHIPPDDNPALYINNNNGYFIFDTEMFKRHLVAKRPLQNDYRIDFWDLFFVKQWDHMPPDDDLALYSNNGILDVEILKRRRQMYSK